MSYKNKKAKKSVVNQLKRKIGLIKIALLRKIKLRYPKKQETMQQQTRTIMQKLRNLSRLIRPNNLRISDWVDEYIEGCVLNGKPVEILTQFCLSKDLEVRYEKQGNKFIPTKAERRAFMEEIPAIAAEFASQGISINWCITLNRSYLDGGRISDLSIEDQYEQMLNDLIKESGMADVLLFNWEDDVLGKRPTSDISVEGNLSKFVSQSAFQIEFERHAAWARGEAQMIQTDEQIEKDLKFQIACEAEEGRLLASSESPISSGRFILIPFELPECYEFFKILVPDFQKRIVPILKPYPWRLE